MKSLSKEEKYKIVYSDFCYKDLGNTCDSLKKKDIYLTVDKTIRISTGILIPKLLLFNNATNFSNVHWMVQVYAPQFF